MTDSIAALEKGVRGRTVQKLLPYLLAAATAVGGWIAGKLDSKAELAAALELRNDFKVAEQNAQGRHVQVLQMFEALINDSVNPKEQGRVVRLEKGQYFAWRALAELRAAAYTDQPDRRRRRMDDLGAKFAVLFDKRAQNQPPAVAYDDLFAQAHVE